jgi:hypothetical protein
VYPLLALKRTQEEKKEQLVERRDSCEEEQV